MDLGDYLKAACSHRWEPGKRDCCTLPADWAVTWGRGDPMAEWRGLYATDVEARSLVARAGGLANLWQRGLEAIDVWGVNDLAPGDIGVIIAVGQDAVAEHVGAIWTGKRWAFRAPAGMIFASAVCVRAWGPRDG